MAAGAGGLPKIPEAAEARVPSRVFEEGEEGEFEFEFELLVGCASGELFLDEESSICGEFESGGERK